MNGIGSKDIRQPLPPTDLAIGRAHSPIFAPISITAVPTLQNLVIIALCWNGFKRILIQCASMLSGM